ncbi:MAG: hypothetical protein ACD_20C00178G0004 [uncultured bacterium]|nr:MAG: hypothetical protein ACD_20C00178G0004 [uncultured bacterium]
MTWGSFFVRSSSLVIVLPLLLTRLTTAEIALWFLFTTIIGLQILVDIGFSPTFSRYIAYGMSGSEIQHLNSPNGQNSGEPNWATIASIYSTMRTVFFRLGLLWTFLLVTIGTYSLLKPISTVDNKYSAWASWAIILVVSTITVQGNSYSAYLQGVNQIALLRRWETITAFCGVVTSYFVLIFDGGLLGLVIANQVWQAISILRNRLLVSSLDLDKLLKVSVGRFNKDVLLAVWPSAWRSGLGILMCYGLIQVSGIIYAQIGDPSSVAAYLLSLRLIQAISQFSQAPFYSKLPLLSRLYADGRHAELLQIARRGMALSHWSYLAGLVGLGLFGAPLLKFVGSNAPFPEQLLWSLLGFGFLIERFGAMHLQLYSTCNHIIWHIVTAVSGTIFMFVSILLFNSIGVYAFAIGIIAGYAGFYSWYSALHSYRKFNINIINFEIGSFILPFIVTATYLIYVCVISYV